MAPTLVHQFNVLLDEDDRRALTQLTEILRISSGAVVRQLLRAGYAHIVSRQATCPDGRSCLVPHLHTSRPAYPIPQDLPAVDA